ncbi:hypothetical protein KJ705_05295 [Patescibacteria group bacterium]|nr:hypothetical protein [Patescibacteria group bacterium]
MTHSNVTVLVIDLLNFLDTRLVDQVFDSMRIRVIRPHNRKALIEVLSHTDGQWSNRPDFILVLNHSQDILPWLAPFLAYAEQAGTRVVNPLSAIQLFEHPLARNMSLKRIGVRVPRFYFGSSATIPSDLGETVVWKSLCGHQTIRCARDGIHSLEDPVYVEELIPNSDRRVLTIYGINDCFYGRWKEDALQSKKKSRKLITDLTVFQTQLQVAQQIGEHFSLIFLNVEFINDVVVDVNTIANFFYPDHQEPVRALGQWILDHVSAG